MREPGASEVLMWALHPQARFHRLCQQTGGQQDAGVGRVGAAGDGGDQHIAITDGHALVALAAGAASECAAASVGLLASISTTMRAPPAGVAVTGDSGIFQRRRHRLQTAARVQQGGWLVEAVFAVGFAEQRRELARHLAQLNAVLRALGAGQAGCHAAQVEGDGLRVVDLARQRHSKQALGAEVRLERFNLGLAAARALKYSMVFSSTGKKPMVAPYSGAMLAMVARRAAPACACLRQKPTNLPTTLCWRRISVTLSTRSVAVHAFAQAAGQFKAHHVRREEVHRLAPAWRPRPQCRPRPAHHANAVDHGGVAVGATRVSG